MSKSAIVFAVCVCVLVAGCKKKEVTTDGIQKPVSSAQKQISSVKKK